MIPTLHNIQGQLKRTLNFLCKVCVLCRYFLPYARKLELVGLRITTTKIYTVIKLQHFIFHLNSDYYKRQNFAGKTKFEAVKVQIGYSIVYI